ncbi:MAG: hypothetical protein JW947_03860 [Sedimentisphaerales bacterium]|nr:hypothetical protein [Sedimentisphaerales bacterium]
MKIGVLKFENGSTGSPFRADSRNGVALVVVAVVTIIFTLLGLSVLSMVNSEIAMARQAADKAKAFYLAEAGVEVFTIKLVKGESAGIGETLLGEGSYGVQFFPGEDPPYAVSTGTVAGQEKKIKVTLSFLAPPYECGIYAGGISGTPWTLILRGTGNPVPSGEKSEVGGKDTVNGNIFVDGDVALYQDSSVNPAPLPNDYNLAGDVDATGNIDKYDTAVIAGDINEGAPPYGLPDLVGMNYAVNNTHNVSQIFASQSLDWRGRLPSGHLLRDVFCKNPTYDRSAECASTTGDDYFFEPSGGFVGGTWKEAPTPLHAGSDRVYYIEGNLWVNSKSDTYGFNMDGKVTIVVTGNIYICDNLKYADANSMLGLVALGKYNTDGDLISGGNVIFGDPTYGTMYICSAMMFAANDFMFNSRAIGTYSAEPESGFTLTGSLAALNRVSIERDWYDKWNGYSYTPKPCHIDHTSNIWVDSVSGAALTPTEQGTIRHYQMLINYDDRVRTPDTQPPGLPKGTGLIFDGITNWEEL